MCKLLHTTVIQSSSSRMRVINHNWFWASLNDNSVKLHVNLYHVKLWDLSASHKKVDTSSVLFLLQRGRLLPVVDVVRAPTHAVVVVLPRVPHALFASDAHVRVPPVIDMSQAPRHLSHHWFLFFVCIMQQINIWLQLHDNENMERDICDYKVARLKCFCGGKKVKPHSLYYDYHFLFVLFFWHFPITKDSWFWQWHD